MMGDTTVHAYSCTTVKVLIIQLQWRSGSPLLTVHPVQHVPILPRHTCCLPAIKPIFVPLDCSAKMLDRYDSHSWCSQSYESVTLQQCSKEPAENHQWRPFIEHGRYHKFKESPQAHPPPECLATHDALYEQAHGTSVPPGRMSLWLTLSLCAGTARPAATCHMCHVTCLQGSLGQFTLYCLIM